jgi:hypothetical protein
VRAEIVAISLLAFPHPCAKRQTSVVGEAAGFEVSSGPGAPIGVKECDDYAARYEACIDKMPPRDKDPLLATFDTQRNVYRDEAASGDKAKLAASCQAALDAIKEKCP